MLSGAEWAWLVSLDHFVNRPFCFTYLFRFALVGCCLNRFIFWKRRVYRGVLDPELMVEVVLVNVCLQELRGSFLASSCLALI